MAGIYIHIPFCRQKCHYCNFFSLASKKLTSSFPEVLKKEIDLTSDYLRGEPVDTIYLGGGTPSVYSPADLQLIVNLLKVHYPVKEGATPEITLELNPDDVTPAFVNELIPAAFNRFSVGVQSFHDRDLKYLNRTHSGAQSLRAVGLLQEAGFGNISIDLIYGIPGVTSVEWEKNLEIAFSLDVPHISAYALTVEQGTALEWMIRKNRSAPVEEEQAVEQFELLMKFAAENGFHHYEISNFARPGRYSVHNANYWKGVPYLGLGPSAHSFNGNSRRWNVAALASYINGIMQGKPLFEEEFLTPDQRYNEYVMTSLRTMWGCNSLKILEDFGTEVHDHFLNQVTAIMNRGLIFCEAGIYFLSDRGKLFADGVASELFIV